MQIGVGVRDRFVPEAYHIGVPTASLYPEILLQLSSAPKKKKILLLHHPYGVYVAQLQTMSSACIIISISSSSRLPTIRPDAGSKCHDAKRWPMIIVVVMIHNARQANQGDWNKQVLNYWTSIIRIKKA
ncbi:hypothetical protein PAHAL_2G484100 [Panicum hallii]|uniref:Uncharacterized protein n=1 Tax=Panicum hallii TaxID=206008 RepID=A0A2T8KTA8_9POAL|nr:hypothetical protein PAHAL_2G484100 [Panicum hallii]